MTHLWRGLAAALMLALALTILVSPAHADSHLSQDAQVNHARWLIENHQPLAALAILRPLNRDARIDITDIRFLIGLAAITAATNNHNEPQKTALLREAINSLRMILVAHPQLTRVRLELARAFFLNGDDDLSRRHFELILAGDQPSAVAINVHRFLHALRARRRWSSYLSFGIEQNDNINSGTDTETIYLFGLPFVVNEQSRPRADTGLSISGGGEYQLPLGEGKRWRFGVDATRSEYDGHEFDQTWLSLRSGPIWTPSQGNEVGVQVFTAQRQVARNRHSKEYGLRFNARHKLTKKFAVNGQSSWRKTEYWHGMADQDDTDFSLSGTYLFSPLLQGSMKIGHARERVKHAGKRSRNVQLGMGAILPKGWTLNGTVGWLRQRHENDAPLTTERQVDSKRILRLFLLNRGVTIFGFSPQIIATRERQQSNFALHEYRRDRVDLRFVRQF